MNKIKIIIPITLSLSSMLCAADTGLGVSIKGNDSSIYLPVRISDQVRIEPFVRYHKDDYSTKSKEIVEFYESNKNNSEGFDVGVGVFNTIEIIENTSIYYGLRMSYSRSSSEYESKSETYSYVREEKLTGYNLSPTLGFEYSITENFTIGFEAEWNYYNLSGDREQINTHESDIYSEINDVKRTGSGTKTRGIVRFYF